MKLPMHMANIWPYALAVSFQKLVIITKSFRVIYEKFLWNTTKQNVVTAMTVLSLHPSVQTFPLRRLTFML